MADETTGAAPVDSLSEDAVAAALDNQFSAPPKQQPKEAPQEVPESDVPEQPDGEPTDADLEAEEAPQQDAASEDTFEIVHNGQQVKLTRAEIIANAQKGFDYDRKTQALAEKQRMTDATLQRLNAVEQVMPILHQDMATVKAIESQLQKYSQVDWVRLATDDPLEYPKYRAQYDQLVNAYQGAVQTYQQKAQAVAQERQNIQAYRLQTEAAQLIQRIPEWADQQKYAAGAQEIRSYLIKEGADPQVVDGLDSAIAISIARKAMLYDRLKSLKADKSKQLRTAPPVVKPGTAQPDKGRSDREALGVIRKAGKAGNTQAQEAALLGLLNKTFK